MLPPDKNFDRHVKDRELPSILANCATCGARLKAEPNIVSVSEIIDYQQRVLEGRNATYSDEGTAPLEALLAITARRTDKRFEHLSIDERIALITRAIDAAEALAALSMYKPRGWTPFSF